MNYSYVMGIEDIEELKDKGFEIQKIKKHYGISFTDDKIDIFESFISKNLAPGFWNEYLGKEKIFIFKFKDGSIKKYSLNSDNEEEVLDLCRKFANYNFESIDKMLKDNSFYSDHYYK